MAANWKKIGSKTIRPGAKPKISLCPAAVHRLPPVVGPLLFLTGLLITTRAVAGVSVFDQVTTPGKPFYLKLRTHRGPLAMGGVRGAFWIEGQMVGRVLTGVDGYGFLQYTATRIGEFRLAARTDAGQAEGRLMVIAPTAPAVLIEVEALAWHMLTRQRAPAVQRVMRQISANYKLIYLCGLIGKIAASELIRSQNMPASAVLTGSPRDQFARLQSRGVDLYAVVGSAALVDAAEGFSPRRFSFDARADAHYVKDGDDLWNQLNQGSETP